MKNILIYQSSNNNTNKPFLIAPIVAKILPDFLSGRLQRKAGVKLIAKTTAPAPKNNNYFTWSLLRATRVDYNSFNSFYQNDTDNNTKKPLLIAPIVVKILPDFFIVEIAAKSGCKANCEACCSCS